MRDADTVLGIIRERGKQELPLEDIYRQLYNPNLYLRAYARLYSNEGAMTKGTTSETVDDMSMKKIEALIDDLRQERYRWTPVRRTYIPKKNGKLRPLGLPSWTDKMLQECMRLILEAYYEPQMSHHSHGFRPERGCHTALSEIRHTWTGTKWFVEGDISKCFDTLDHTVMMSILSEKLHDNRFLRLVQNLLQAGYLEEWHYHETLSGSPQGGVISPILSNVYLDKLDKFVEEQLLPGYNHKQRRQRNARYDALLHAAWEHRKRGEYAIAEKLRKQAQQMPSYNPSDPEYRRLHYVRYADDTLFGFVGTKAEAEEIKRRLGEFLHEHLKLELSEEKTLITHAQTQKARFLGYDIVVQHQDDKHDQRKRRVINGTVALRVPKDVIENKCALYMRKGKPTHRAELLQDDDFTTISRYQSEYRGLVQYYLPTQNVSVLAKLHWVMETSLLKTLANKHQVSMMHMVRKYKSTTETPYGKMKCLEITMKRENKKPLVARFGGIPLRQREKVSLVDLPFSINKPPERNELIKRLLANECEMCGSRQDIRVHHIRKLADLETKGGSEKPRWVKIMSTRRRKTLVVCHQCHMDIHAGRPMKRQVQK
jgi:group II intron reverse transcriptase/maturase